MNTSFITDTNIQFAWDSTSLGTLKECPRKYQLSIIQGWRPKDHNVHLEFGTCYHAALETYDREKAKGASHEEAERTCVRRALTDTWNKEKNRPIIWDHKYKNRLTLIRTIVWYLDKFKDDVLETIILADGKPAVELSFRFETDIVVDSNTRVWLCGHLDRLVTFQDAPYILDRKTTKYAVEEASFFERYNPDNQMSTYDLAGKVVYNIDMRGIMIDAAQILITGSRFKRGFTHRTPEQRNEWFNDTRQWIGLANFFADTGYWPMNDKSCGNYGGCEFRGICNKSPLVREKLLQSSFHKRIWDPLVIRGDI